MAQALDALYCIRDREIQRLKDDEARHLDGHERLELDEAISCLQLALLREEPKLKSEKVGA